LFLGEKEEDHYLLMKKPKGDNENSRKPSEVIYKMNKIIEAEKYQIKPVNVTSFLISEIA
jgi:hypothetical protein